MMGNFLIVHFDELKKNNKILRFEMAVLIVVFFGWSFEEVYVHEN